MELPDSCYTKVAIGFLEGHCAHIKSKWQVALKGAGRLADQIVKLEVPFNSFFLDT
jgi:hypothetical protein